MTQLEKLMQNAALVVTKIEMSVSGVEVTGSRSICASALHSLSIRHYRSILLLLAHDSRSSALALLRPCRDAAQRAVYVELFGTDTDLLERIAADKRNAFGYQSEMVDAIHKRLGSNVFEEIHSAWDILCSYTHGGVRQTDRQFTADGVLAESVSDEECIAALTSVTFPLVLTTVLVAALWRGEPITGANLVAFYRNTMPIPLGAEGLI